MTIPEQILGAPTSVHSWPKLQWVGATGSSRPGTLKAKRSGLSRFASTRIDRLSTVRACARSARPRTVIRRCPRTKGGLRLRLQPALRTDASDAS